MGNCSMFALYNMSLLAILEWFDSQQNEANRFAFSRVVESVRGVKDIKLKVLLLLTVAEAHLLIGGSKGGLKQLLYISGKLSKEIISKAKEPYPSYRSEEVINILKILSRIQEFIWEKEQSFNRTTPLLSINSNSKASSSISLDNYWLPYDEQLKLFIKSTNEKEQIASELKKIVSLSLIHI